MSLYRCGLNILKQGNVLLKQGNAFLIRHIYIYVCVLVLTIIPCVAWSVLAYDYGITVGVVAYTAT